MRLGNLKKPFVSLKDEDKRSIVEQIQMDRLKDKRGIREAAKLTKEIEGLTEEDKAHVLSVIRQQQEA